MAKYAELHCHSAFSFLDGVCLPEELVEKASKLGLSALAITDHNGLYGAARFARAAAAEGLPTVFGAEISIGAAGPRTQNPDPPASHVVVLAKSPEGYRRLSSLITRGQLRGRKGMPLVYLEELGEGRGEWFVLSGCRKGPLSAALEEKGDPRAAEQALLGLIEAVGRDNLGVEIWLHGDPVDTVRNDVLAELAARHGLPVVATQNAHYCSPSKRYLHYVVSAIRAGKTLADLNPWLPVNGGAYLRSPAEQERRFARWPGAVENAHLIGQECSFPFSLLSPGLPSFAANGPEEAARLRKLVYDGAHRYYGLPAAERVGGAYRQLDHELRVIEDLGFAGYFLLVWDIVRFCKERGIMCQGRGSAANSAVCYVLGITRADPVALGLLFERFLSPYRDGPPDIDLDIEAGRREEVIQYVFRKYGRTNAAQVASVIEYRFPSAFRDVARALSYSEHQINQWSARLRRRRGASIASWLDTVPPEVVSYARQLVGLPRHLGLHTGGIVISKVPVSEICPVEWATHPGRNVLQWDKDDCAYAGFVKFDLLGLRMLQAIKSSIEAIGRSEIPPDPALLPQEEAVYDMLSAGDTVGVFQVESRAQMNTVVRMKPRCFYDLVIEVALIRPGPIQSGSVHPYLRRRAGLEPVTYLHPLLEPALRKTLGVPIFQEQLMRMAMDAASFSAQEADALRAALSSKRSAENVERLKARLMEGFASNGIPQEVGEQIYKHLLAFADFGFPESHSISFAYITYISAWLKLHYPAAFYLGLLNSQPMGFWSPATIVEDARRHGIGVLAPDVNESDWDCTLKGEDPRTGPIIMGLSYVRGLSRDGAERIVEGRPYESLGDLASRTRLSRKELACLIKAGATKAISDRRERELLFDLPILAQAADPERIPSLIPIDGEQAPLKQETTLERTLRLGRYANAWWEGHPVAVLRRGLSSLRPLALSALKGLPHGAKVTVMGMVTHRQRPETAKGAVFVNLEDETGLVNVTFSRGAWERWADTASASDFLLVMGTLEREGESLNVRAELVKAIGVPEPTPSRNFR
jgi:error-prone DNA polymerase